MLLSPFSERPTVVLGPSYHVPQAPLQQRKGWWSCWVDGLKRAWLSTQVSHRGQYSVERLLALAEYTRTTSWVRAVFVCVGTPLPVFVLVLAQESVPLQDPTRGWRVNYGIWVRGALVSGVVARTIVIQLKHLVGGVAISSRQVGLVAVAVMAAYTALSVAIAANVFFPIPFMTITMTLPFLVLVICFFRLSVGGRAIHEVVTRREQLLRFTLFLSAQTFMSVMYPAYQALFQAASETGYELFVVGLLPVLKLLMRNLIAQCFSRMDDMMPEAVIFTVDFFNAFYIATSMQNASSTTTVVVIVAADLLHTALALQSVHRRTSSLMSQLCEKLGTDGDVPHLPDLLEKSRSLCRHCNEFNSNERAQLQLRSCIPYRLSPENRHLLDRLDKPAGCHLPAKGRLLCRLKRNSTADKPTWPCGSRRSNVIHPLVEKNDEQTRTAAEQDAIVNSPRHAKQLREVLEILFTSECLVLSEYLEAFVPILYANYVVAMVRLPSAKYHSELAGITPENVGDNVQTVVAYAFLEFLSFVVLVIIMKRNTGVRSLHHLAFVLETHMPLIQDKLMAWVLLTLGSRVVHFGVDFTFRFAWLATKA
ncbi:hypothetical protein PHYPSEUDO_008130 [Phytophthora pseudosyringae]|uniref:Transmembrane protein n=1 Tax=Phytophthora pseudosyringae TaxID=221518 RepID=A0A8T1VI01_9STRA|nr:hypothetical protein PHYPSEUDO_008130 [Phytophthora pseudosyringae]